MDVRLTKLPSSDHHSTVQLNSCKLAIKVSCSRSPAQGQQATLGCNELLAKDSCTPTKLWASWEDRWRWKELRQGSEHMQA